MLQNFTGKISDKNVDMESPTKMKIARTPPHGGITCPPLLGSLVPPTEGSRTPPYGDGPVPPPTGEYRTPYLGIPASWVEHSADSAPA